MDWKAAVVDAWKCDRERVRWFRVWSFVFFVFLEVARNGPLAKPDLSIAFSRLTYEKWRLGDHFDLQWVLNLNLARSAIRLDSTCVRYAFLFFWCASSRRIAVALLI